MTKYKIVRHYFNSHRKYTVQHNLTLEEAQAHCRDPQSSSGTCYNSVGKARTKAVGPWFDGYTEDK